jgi:Helix-turn-helix domain/DnaA N-terminal domain
MSWEASAYVKKLRVAPDGEPLTKNEKLVLLHLADAHNAESRIAWPSVRTIAEDCLTSHRSAQLILHELERKGVIQVIRPERNGRGRFLSYRFPELDAEYEKGANRASFVRGSGKARETRKSQAGNVQEMRTKDAPESFAIRKEQRTDNTGTEQQFGREKIPEGLDQDRGEQLWCAIREYVEGHVNKHSFEIWFKPPKAAGCRAGVLWIRVPSPEFKAAIEKYADLIKEALSSKEIHDIKEVNFTC